MPKAMSPMEEVAAAALNTALLTADSRERAIERFANAFGGPDHLPLAAELDQACADCPEGQTDLGYQKLATRLSTALRKNNVLRKRVLCRQVRPQALVIMSDYDLEQDGRARKKVGRECTIL